MADLSGQITQIISEQRGYANSAVSAALSAASRANGGFDPYPIDATLAFQNNAPTPGSAGNAPTFSGNYVAPTYSANLQGLESLYIPTLPDVREAPEPIDTSNLFKQEVPVFDLQPFTETVPDVDTNIDLPDAPQINLPDQPTIKNLDLPDAPDVTIPDFELRDVSPYDPGEMGNVVAKAEEVYKNSLPEMREFLNSVVKEWMNQYAPDYDEAMAKLEAKIAAGIDGGTAMSNDVEQQIFDRLRERTEKERQRAENDLLTNMARRGYSLPPGAVSAGLNQIQQQASANIAGAAAETAIERAKMENEHAQFIMQLSATMHTNMLNTAVQYASQLVQINGQALQYSKDIANSLVTEYNARLDRYKTEIQLAQTQADIYETQLKAAFADIEIYQIQIRAAELEKNVEQINVSIYRSLLDAESTKIQNYRAQLEGVSIEANLRKLQIEIYSEQVRAYVSQVGAKEAEFRVYTAAIGGDEAKVRAYATEVQAYGQEVSAQKSVADIEIAHSNAISEYNKNIIEEFRAEITAYVAELDAAKTTFGADVEGYRARLEAYKTQQIARLETLNTNYKHAALDLDAARASLDARVQTEVAVREIAQRGISAGGSVAASVAGAMSSLAGSAASATNTIVNLAQESTG